MHPQTVRGNEVANLVILEVLELSFSNTSGRWKNMGVSGLQST